MRVCSHQKLQGHSLLRPPSHHVFCPRRGRRKYRSQSCFRQGTMQCNSVGRGNALGDLALINVDYISPSLWLGVVLGITGMILYSLKFRDAKGTTEGDIVAASLFVMCGGILTLQGWRLDPILMLSEFVLGGVGIFYMVQTVNLRKQLENLEEAEQVDDRMSRWPLPRQRSYESFDGYDQLPEGTYRQYSDTFKQPFQSKRFESADISPSTDSTWPRTSGRGGVRPAPDAPLEESWADDYGVDVPYGVDTSSPKGRVSPDMWEQKKS